MPSPTNSLGRQWSLHQKRAFYEMCAIGEQLIHSKIDYHDIVAELTVELISAQQAYIKNAQMPTAEVPVP